MAENAPNMVGSWDVNDFTRLIPVDKILEIDTPSLGCIYESFLCNRSDSCLPGELNGQDVY